MPSTIIEFSKLQVNLHAANYMPTIHNIESTMHPCVPNIKSDTG